MGEKKQAGKADSVDKKVVARRDALLQPEEIFSLLSILPNIVAFNGYLNPVRFLPI
ncbi:MAG: hypothetical protein H6654_13190 [Ardenticatenaceae bacterium]|nr:hypothetical protein [Anaerolineales bacterium]MCB8974507.1 hypothetical protein [Ardenticatenaceae bacterium]